MLLAIADYIRRRFRRLRIKVKVATIELLAPLVSLYLLDHFGENLICAYVLGFGLEVEDDAVAQRGGCHLFDIFITHMHPAFDERVAAWRRGID